MGVYMYNWIPELGEVLTMKREVSKIDLHVALISLVVDVGGGIYSRAAFIRGWCLVR